MKLLIISILVLMVLIIGCSNDKETINQEINNEKISNGKNDKTISSSIVNEVVLMKLSSPDFKHNAMMPSELTCDGDGTSPELSIEDIPKNAKSLVLVNDDPDAPVG